MVLLGIADEISAHFIDCGMVSCSVSLCTVLGTKVLCKVGINKIYVLWRWQFMASWQSISHLLYNLVSLFSGVSAAIFFAFTGTFSLQSSLSFTSSLSSTPGTISLPPFSQPFAPLFCCLCSMSSSLPFVSVPSPIFLLLH